MGGKLARVLTEERVAEINGRIAGGGLSARLASLFGRDSGRTTEVTYAGMDEKIAEATADMLGNLSQLRKTFGDLRHAPASGGSGGLRSYEGFPLMNNTRSVSVGRATPRFLETNVEIWEIVPGGSGLRALFFPDALVLFRRGRYEAVPYGDVAVSGATLRFAGRPQYGSAQSAGVTWEHTNLDGLPDQRFKSNPMAPVAYYHTVTLAHGASNFYLKLLIPHEEAAGVIRETFVAAFRVAGSRGSPAEEGAASSGDSSGASTETNAGKSPPRQGRARREEARRERPAPRPDSPDAREVLGVGPAASAEEIASAYRDMARKYHPDRVEGLGPEFEELATRRMKQINAAYRELRGPAGA